MMPLHPDIQADFLKEAAKNFPEQTMIELQKEYEEYESLLHRRMDPHPTKYGQYAGLPDEDEKCFRELAEKFFPQPAMPNL